MAVETNPIKFRALGNSPSTSSGSVSVSLNFLGKFKDANSTIKKKFVIWVFKLLLVPLILVPHHYGAGLVIL